MFIVEDAERRTKKDKHKSILVTEAEAKNAVKSLSHYYISIYAVRLKLSKSELHKKKTAGSSIR